MEYFQKEHYTAEDLMEIVSRLRDPVSGCPWDKVQTHASIRKNFLEETYEVLEAIDAQNAGMLCEELGDVLMQVALHTCMEQEKGSFTFSDVCSGVCRKLIHRHPHIFAKEENNSLTDWETLKNKEKGRTGLKDELCTVPVTFPALMKAQKMQKRAARYGVAAKDADAAYALMEESQKRLAALAGREGVQNAEKERQQAAGEFLFYAADWLRCYGVDAEESLEKQTKKFCAEQTSE